MLPFYSWATLMDWEKKILPVGRTSSNTSSFFFVFDDRWPIEQIHTHSWAVDDGFSGQGLEKNKIGKFVSKNSGKELCEWTPENGQIVKIFVPYVNAHQWVSTAE